MPTLPLFPLGTVLTPGERLPLRIFEPRYVAMLRDLLARRKAGEEDVFGVVAIRKGQEVGEGKVIALHEIGCAARLDQVSDAGHQSFAVMATGVRRFRLESVERDGRTPYATGFVTWLNDHVRDPELVAHVAGRLTAAVQAYRDQVGLSHVELPTEPSQLSYDATRHVMLDVTDRQRLLSARDVDSRLLLALRLARRETTLVRELAAMPGAYSLPTPSPH